MALKIATPVQEKEVDAELWLKQDKDGTIILMSTIENQEFQLLRLSGKKLTICTYKNRNKIKTLQKAGIPMSLLTNINPYSYCLPHTFNNIEGE